MNKLSIFVLMLSAIFFISCSQPSLPETKLSVNLTSTGKDKLEVFNIEKEIHHALSGQADSLKIEITDDVILDLVQGRTHHYVYVKSGDNLMIDTVSSRPLVLNVVDNPSKENEYLVSYAKTSSQQSEAFQTPYLAKKEVDSFLIEIANKYAPLEKIIAEINNDDVVTDGFKSAMKLRLMAERGNDMMMFKGMYKYWNKKEATIPEDFYAETESMNLTDPALLLFEGGRQLGDSFHSKDIDYDSFESETEYFAALQTSANKNYPNTLLRDYCSYNMVSNSINYGAGIDEAEGMIKDFKSTVKNTYLNTKLDETIEPWLSLKKGLAAPDFKANTRDGKEVLLSELKGKKVYIDVWATWCGPCIKEIPALKELEKELHDEDIEFVSVSIDNDSDKQKWLDFIKDKEMEGVQLMANGAWESDVVKSYNIRGIPRFLLVDEEGKIITSNAPRPSDPKIKDVLLN